MGPPRTTVVVGHAVGWQQQMSAMATDTTAVFVEEPELVRRRDVRRHLADSPFALLEWEYQSHDTVDDFVAAHSALDPVAVVPAVDYAVPFAARLAARYGLPGTGVRAADLTRDKYALREVTRAAGIPNPECREVTDPAEVTAFLAAHGGPVVVKPANRQGSLGTRIVASPDEVPAAWAQTARPTGDVLATSRGMPTRVLVESFLAGPEFSVEMVVRGGDPAFANVTGKMLFPGPHPVESGHVVPADITEDLSSRLLADTARVVRAIGFDTGFIHCEWIVVAGVPTLVECAGRMPGDLIGMLLDLAYDAPIAGAYVQVLGDREPDPPLPREAGGVAAVQFGCAPPGCVTRIDGLDDALDVDDVIDAYVLVTVGADVAPLRSSSDRVAVAIAVGDTAKEATVQARAAVDLIVVTTEPRR